jgi:hypothetical protein
MLVRFPRKNAHALLSIVRTAETFAKFIQPLLTLQEQTREENPEWIVALTLKMAQCFAKANRRCPRNLEEMTLTANSGRIYFEQLHLHPVRLGLTFTQEWMDSSGGSDNVMVFQFIRGMVSVKKIVFLAVSFQTNIFASGINSKCPTCFHVICCGTRV